MFRSNRRGEGGQGLIEFAAIFPFLFFFFFVFVVVGIFFF
jgi:hypothetical protein